MGSNEMKILHIGLGTRGQRWLSAVQEYPGAKSVGCVEPVPSVLDRASKRCPSLTFGQDLEEALRKVPADAAIIAGTPELRATHAMKALEAGLAVMVEEPFSTSLTDATAVLNVSRRTGKPLIVMSHEPVTRVDGSLHSLITGSKVGTVTHLSCTDRRADSGSAPESGAYCQLLSVGIHHLEMLRRVLGTDPVSLIARCSRSSPSRYQHGLTTEIFLEMGKDIHLHYFGSLTSNRNELTLWIEGDKGVVRADQSRVWWRKRGWKFFAPLFFQKVSYSKGALAPKAWLDQLSSALSGGQGSKVDERNALWPVSMVEAIRRSDETGTVTQIPRLLASAEASIGFSSSGVQSVIP
jgi:predicted dehydrogenase